MVGVQAPTAEEHLSILGRAFPQLSALLPAGLAALSLVKTAAGQSWDTTDVRLSLYVVAHCSVLLPLSLALAEPRVPSFAWALSKPVGS